MRVMKNDRKLDKRFAKRMMSLMLSGVLAFSMTACGDNAKDEKASVSGESVLNLFDKGTEAGTGKSESATQSPEEESTNEKSENITEEVTEAETEAASEDTADILERQVLLKSDYYDADDNWVCVENRHYVVDNKGKYHWDHIWTEGEPQIINTSASEYVMEYSDDWSVYKSYRDGILTGQWKYDGDLLIRDYSFNSDGSFDYVFIYSYDNMGMKIKEEKSRSEEEGTDYDYYTLFEYDEKGQLIKETSISGSNSDFSEETTYKYDDNGNLLLKRRENHGPSTEGLFDQMEYSYDERNHCISEARTREVSTGTSNIWKSRTDFNYEYLDDGYKCRLITLI